MINFRFHLVSLIAVFLALALGIVVGSTVIDRAIVDVLEDRIERVEDNANAQREENSRLLEEFGDVRDFAEQAAPFVIEGQRLGEVPVAVFATRGIDEHAVGALVDALRRAGAVAPVVLWLERSWSIEDRAERDALRDVLGLPRADPDALRAAGFERLAARVTAGQGLPAPPAQETTPVPADDVLPGLIVAGFVGLDRAGGPELDLAALPGPGARVIVVSGSEAPAAEVVFPNLVRSMADAGLLTLAVGVTETHADDEANAGVVRLVRSDDDLSDRVSSVDSATSTTGQAAVVLALEELGRGEHGHYGLEPGADRRLPEPAGA